MDEDKTMVFDVDSISEKEAYDKLRLIYDNLEERGYNPVNQIVGYILSGDLGYISSYKNSRKMMSELDRSMLTEVLLKKFLS
ncbi:MAG: IreB family regulatory phosphoprotein [Bacilli bacterium]|nr:IreB family regulatory phosphoprotein [Bacilli bacterium]